MGTLEKGSHMYVKERKKIRNYLARSTEEKEE